MKTDKIGEFELQTWTAEEVQKAFAANEIVIVDVRTPAEYMFEHIEGALLAPLSWFRPENLPSQKDKRLLFHCGSGKRSEKVARECLQASHSSVAHLGGGFAAWKKAGMPYMGTDVASGAPKRMQDEPAG